MSKNHLHLKEMVIKAQKAYFNYSIKYESIKRITLYQSLKE